MNAQNGPPDFSQLSAGQLTLLGAATIVLVVSVFAYVRFG
jgi:hypothetical protein